MPVFLLYPLLIGVGLYFMPPRYLALLLALSLLLRHARYAKSFLSGLAGIHYAILGTLLVFSGAIVLSDSETLLRFYPAVINGGMLLLFSSSLLRPPSMIERFARITEPDLPLQGVIYTRKVTWLWCAFFILNGSIAAWSALFASREVWAIYNGGVAYLLMGALFAGEWLFRRHVRSSH